MDELERKLGYSFREPALLRQALIHPSFKQSKDNQRLEFLGDAVLEFLLSELLYHKYPQDQEGDLTARRATLVCEETLSTLAKRLTLGRFLQIGQGERQQQGHEKPSILADAMEAVLAAVYLDGGFEAVQTLIQKLYADEEALSLLRGRDEKGLLQERTQARGMELPVYEIIEETGPAHQKHFVAQVRIMGTATATGQGNSKKAAEQAAAKAALAVFDNR